MLHSHKSVFLAIEPEVLTSGIVMQILNVIENIIWY